MPSRHSAFLILFVCVFDAIVSSILLVSVLSLSLSFFFIILVILLSSSSFFLLLDPFCLDCSVDNSSCFTLAVFSLSEALC